MEARNMVERDRIGATNVDSQQRAEARSILSEVLETHLLPPDRFKDNQQGEVVDIKKIGETVAVLKKVDDHYEAAIFDRKGSASPLFLDPSAKHVFNNSDSWFQKGRIRASSGYPTDIQERFIAMKYPNDLVSTLRRGYIERIEKAFVPDKDGDISVKEILSSSLFFPVGEWNLDVLPDKKGKPNFVFSVGDAHVFKLLPQQPNKVEQFKRGNFRTIPPKDNLTIGDLNVKKDGSGFHITDRGSKILASYSGSQPIVDPANPNNFHFIDKGQVFRLDLQSFKTPVAKPSVEKVNLQEIHDVQTLNFDPNGNFFIIRSGDNKLMILDKETGGVVRTFENAKGPVLVDNQGNILFVDTENRLREIQTNFQTITAEGKEEALRKKGEDLRQRQEEFTKLELTTVARPQTSGISQEDVANTLRETISRQVTEKITVSTNPQDLEGVLDSLQALKSDPANQAYQKVIDEFVNQAIDSLSGIRTAELDTQLNAYQQTLDEVKSVEDSIGLDQQFARLLQERQKIDISDYNKRREIDQRIRAIQTKKDALIGQYQGELVVTIQQTFPQIEELVIECGSPQELVYLSTSTQVQQFEIKLANVRDPQVRKELRERYNQIKTEQRAKLERGSRELEEQNRQRWAQVVEESREELVSLQEQIVQLADGREIDRFGRNPLVGAWKTKLSALPQELRESLEKRLETILGVRKKEVERRKELGAVGETGGLRFGNVTFPVYEEPPRIWQPKLVPRKGGFSGLADLVFEDTQGRIFKPGGGQDVVVSTNINDEKARTTIDRYRMEADGHFKRIKRMVPELNERWRTPGYQMSKLEELAESINLQLTHHMGITILEGETGTGKNVLADLLANLSNREVVTISCNRKTSKEDLTYEFYYDPQKGTYKLPSKLVEGIQTPGTIVMFDEVNTLESGISKMLSPVFDYRRTLYSAEGGVRKETVIDPTVILMGAMNPQDYIGVEPLAETISSRADIIEVGYPPFEEMRSGRTYYRSDEAEILAAHMNSLGQFSQKELKLCWDNVVNRDSTNGADIILGGNPQIETDIRRIYDVIRVANRLRDMYKEYQLGSSNEPMDFVTSLRETINIVLRMNHGEGVKEIVKRVILPKVGDRRQRVMVNQTIDGVLPGQQP